MEKIYFATGCFWGAERKFWQTKGVIATAVGYMGGTTENPSYESVCEGNTGHAEVVEVLFDSSIITARELLKLFWTMHDPTSFNRQGNDFGSQYRSAIFYSAEKQHLDGERTRDLYQAALTRAGYGKICTEILDARETHFWPAESYHQRYLAKNPLGYDCHSSTGIDFPKE